MNLKNHGKEIASNPRNDCYQYMMLFFLCIICVGVHVYMYIGFCCTYSFATCFLFSVLLLIFKIITILRYNSHSIKFTLLKCDSLVFSIFTGLYTQQHYLISEYFHHLQKKS